MAISKLAYITKNRTHKENLILLWKAVIIIKKFDGTSET
jgi:hypothetical protein